MCSRSHRPEADCVQCAICFSRVIPFTLDQARFRIFDPAARIPSIFGGRENGPHCDSPGAVGGRQAWYRMTAPSRSLALERARQLHFPHPRVRQHQILALADVSLYAHRALAPQSWMTRSDVLGKHPPLFTSLQPLALRLEPIPQSLPPHEAQIVAAFSRSRVCKGRRKLLY